MFDFFKEDLKKRKQSMLYRELSQAQGLDFISNDYLNLSTHPLIRKKMAQALDQNINLSSRSSRLLAGTTCFHEKTEAALQEFTGRDCVLSFSSGYLANVGVIPALSKNKVIFSDELNHASLIDGIRLSDSPCQIFPHKDLNRLEAMLKKEKKEKLIVTESLFSMEGDFAPLKELSDLALKYQALLFVDEAHTTGLFGRQFSGCVYDLKDREHIVSLHTCGKALGSSGAFVASSMLIGDYLINNCRTLIYTTAPPPLLMIQWQAALDVLKTEVYRPLELRKKSLAFRTSLNLLKSESPIIPIVLKDTKQSLEQAQFLRDKGFYVKAIRYPTVPKNREGLRLVLKYGHSEKDLEQLKSYL
ncbi:MAG: aminotransferase class I/II-fold pyridoxal phosphate-dependent enzyme [Bdellovibrionales bacterium]